MGSLDYDAAMYDLIEPSSYMASDWNQAGSIFDCGGVIKDWGNSTQPSTSSSSSLALASTAAAPAIQDHSLYIDPCCDFGDVFFNSGYQTTPISVLDYVHQQSSDSEMSFGGMFSQQEDQDIQELLAGFTSQFHQPTSAACQPQPAQLAHPGDDFLDHLQLPHQQQQQQQQVHQQAHQVQQQQQKVEIHHQQPSFSNSTTSCMSPSISSQGSSSFTPPQALIKSEPVFINPKLEHLEDHRHLESQHQQHQQQAQKAAKQEIIVQQQQQQQNPYLPKFEPVDQQLRLVRMLLSCANAVAEENLDVAGATLVQLRGMVVPHGSPMERLASYVTEALVARLSRNTRSSMFRGLVCDKLQELSSTTRSDMLEAFWVFYEYVPIGKFTHLTMNQILLDAADRERSIHVIDFQVWYGAQWPSFIQSLALRPGGPPMLRMTAVGASLRDLQEAGNKLLDCARGLNVPFEYCILEVELEQFHAGMIELRDGETVLINSLCQFHCFLNRDEAFVETFLQGLRALRPRMVVMAENDADHNSPVFLHRFMSCLQYYSAVFDAFDASLHMPGTLRGRQKLEELIAAQKLRNMIACEGSERVERHESMQAWNSRMETAGFRAVSMSHKAINQASLLLRLYFSNGYTLTNQDGFLILGWRGMPLNGVGAWI